MNTANLRELIRIAIDDVLALAVRVDAPRRVLEAAAALVERMPPKAAAGIEGGEA